MHYDMTTAILPSSTISTSTTTYTSKASAAPGIKLAPLIHQANVVSYERRHGKMWFIIHVDPQQFNNTSTCLKRHPYTIARRYDDCVQFSHRLHDAFPCLNNNTSGRAGSRTAQEQKQLSHCIYNLPKLKPHGLLNKKQSNGQRRAELDRFVQALFRLPSTITQALIVLEFFGLQKSDTEQQVLRDKQNLVRQQQAIVNSTAKYQMYVGGDYSFFDDPFFNPAAPMTVTSGTMDMDRTLIDTEDASKWASKFKTFRGRSPSSNSLSSFCTQAANRLPWTTPSSTLLSSTSSPNASMSSLLSPKKKISFTTPFRSGDDLPPMTGVTMPTPGLISCSSSTTSSNSVSSAGSTLPTYYQQQPVLPGGRRRRSSTRTSHCSNQSSSGLSQPIPSTSFSTSSDPTGVRESSGVRMMKLKVIYDVDNIIVIQIPRSTNLAALRTRLHDKFSTMLDPSLKPLADQFVLLYNENTRTSSSSSELHLDQHQSPMAVSSSPSISLISSEQQWTNAMKTWDSLEKVTLRCIH